MNFATVASRGPNTSIHNLFGTNNTMYCTGVTTGPLNLRSATPRIQFSFLYKMNDQNVTGQVINVIPEITTNASLNKVFGVGACDRCGANINCSHAVGFDTYTQTQQQYFPALGSYFATVGVQTGPPVISGGFGPAGATVYGYLDIQAITTDVKIIVSANTQPPSIAMIELV